MEDHQLAQEANHEKNSTAHSQRPVLTLSTNPNSWFRKRLDYVRNEARKDIQTKSIRPLHEK